MYIMELALQGVRRFEKSRKFSLKSGLEVVYGPTESGKSTLVACILDLLYPDRLKEDEPTLVTRGDASSSRGGLTISSGKEVYRVLKDFRAQHVTLTQYNPASQKFESMAEGPGQVSSALASALELPTYEVFYHLFLSSVDRMPSVLPLAEEKEVSMEVEASQPSQSPGEPVQNPFQQQQMSGPAVPGGGAFPGMAPGGGQAPPATPGMPAMPAMPGAPATPGMPAAPAMTAPGMMMQEDDGMTPEEREEKLLKLREEQEQAQKIEEIQYDIDGLQQQLFEIESKKKSATQFDEFLEEAEEQLNKYPALKRLPQNMEERLDRYKDLDRLQSEEVEKHDQKLAAYDEQMQDLQDKPKLTGDQLFQLALALAGLGIISLILSRSVEALQSIKFLFLLIIPGLGLGGWRVWNHIDIANKKAELEDQIKKEEERREAVIKKFQVETAVIDKLMNDTDSDNISELREKIEKFQDLEAKYKSVLDRKNKIIKDLNMDALNKQEKELKEKINKLEEELKKYPALSMDLNQIKKEMERLEKIVKMTNPQSKALQGQQAAPAQEGFAVPDLEPASEDKGSTQAMGGQQPAPGETPQPQQQQAAAPGGSTQVMGGSSPGDSGATRAMRTRAIKPAIASEAYEKLIQNSAHMFNTERNKLIKHVQQRLNQYVEALFGKRYKEAWIGPDGSVTLRRSEDKKWVEFDELTPAARDTCYLALKITLLELATQKKVYPIIMDNPFAQLDENAAGISMKAVKRLSDRAQVILFTPSSAPLQLADNKLTLE